MVRATLTLIGLLVVSAVATPLAAQEAAQATPDLQRALEHASVGEFAEAIALLEPLAAKPDSPPAVRALIGAFLVESGRAEAAHTVLAPLAAAPDADPAVLYNAGRAAATLGRLEESEQWLRRSLAIESGTPAARELGIVLARTAHYEEAYPLLKPWAEAPGAGEDVRTIAALCAVQLRRPAEAETFIVDLPADRPEVQLLRAEVRQLRGDPFGAITLLEPLLASAPPAMGRDVRRQLAEAYTMTAQAEKAVELLAGQAGDDPAIALQLGTAQYQSGDVEGALATLAPFAQAALADGGEDGDRIGLRVAVEYGRLLVGAGRHADALLYLEAAVERDPGDKRNWQQLGQALAVVGRTEEARQALARFEEIVAEEGPISALESRLERELEDPTGGELRKASELAAAGNFEEALEVVRREAALVPADPRPRLLESRILLQAGRHEEAMTVAELVAAAVPENADAVYQRGAVRVATGDLATAEADFRRALELAPEHTAAMSDLAVLLADRGETEEARALLERVLALRPGDPLATANLERLGE